MRLLFVLCLAAVLILPSQADGYRCEIKAYPVRVVEEMPFKITVSYHIPAGKARLNCELKNPRNIVMAGETARVSGKGTHTFTLLAPARSAETEILVAAWIGEDWRKPLASIEHTSVIQVLSRSEQRRLEWMKSEVAAALKRLGYKRSPAGNIAILDDAFPGLDHSVPKILAQALAKKGIGVTFIDAEAASNPYLLTRSYFDLLVLSDSRIFPAAALDSLQRFLESRGHLISLNGPAFTRLVWQVGGKWLDREGILKVLADAPGRKVFLDFRQADASAWQRGTNDNSSPASVSFDAPGPESGSQSAHFTIENLTGWDTFASPPLENPCPSGHQLIQFYARGDGKTSQLSVEWREKDGSRWIAVIPLTARWKRYALTPEEFRYWQDSPSKGRGGPGDHFNPANAGKIIFGLAFTHTAAVGGGKHEFFIAEVATAPMPTGMASIEKALHAEPVLPVIEGISPAYKLYHVTDLKKFRTNPYQVLWKSRKLPIPATTLAPHPRPNGAGFMKERRWRWIPLLEAKNGEGMVGGAVVALIINGRKPYEGGLWLTIPITDRTFFKNEAVANAIADAAARMLDGVFLYEGGSDYYTYMDGEKIRLGAEVVNFGRKKTEIEVEILIGGTAVDLRKQFSVSLAPGKRQKVEITWSPGRYIPPGHYVLVELKRNGRTIDRLHHFLSVWRPSESPEYVTIRDGDFYLKGKKWYPHGVNYMPSSGIGIEDGEYFEYWLDPQPYDPEIIAQDLADIKAIGMNMVSVFIYYRSIDSHNLLDFLLRCRQAGMMVNLSLRPGTPMDFRWNEIRALIQKHRLPENDTVFAYDLAWEPFFGPYNERMRWDLRWQEWVTKRYGSIEAAEKAWDFPMPRVEGRVTGPSDQQVAQNGPWVKMASVYRRFVDDLLNEKYGEARRLVRSIDPNHPVSFRMTVAGDPTCGQEAMPYDLKGLAGAVDIMCPEGYGRIGNWERVKDGWFTAAYSRCVAPGLPMMWAEFGTSVWDNSRMESSQSAMKFQADFYRDFYEMTLRSGANGTVCWWFPGGYRVGERSDFGILNPDHTWRPVTHIIHDYAARMTAGRDIPKPDILIPINRHAHADGIKGVYTEVKDAFWKAIDEGKFPGLKWMDEGE